MNWNDLLVLETAPAVAVTAANVTAVLQDAGALVACGI
jgi:Mrp family chromosome partitioning ATPase